ncbi:MAG: 2-oxoglutarate dehydrogenase E1 subunit family protein, partial [Nocardioides sp.]
MSQSPGAPAELDPSDDFGANEWLVEEMHERYLKDPAGVDPAWAAYFRKNPSP